jgi:transcriptional regulator with PAS, ATPase and Fis domain
LIARGFLCDAPGGSGCKKADDCPLKEEDDMNEPDWVEGFPAAITVADREGRILYMNDAASKGFEKWGGRDALIGKSLKDCHMESSWQTILGMMSSGSKNVYTTEKAGVKKLILQSPWYEGETCAGTVEISFEVPFDIPNRRR